MAGVKPGRIYLHCLTHRKRAYCSCYLSQLQKLSCEHVISTCAKERDCANIIIYSLCASWYTVKNYYRAYALRFHPVPGSRYWPDKNVEYITLPPEVSRPQGRSQSTRIRNTMDEEHKDHRLNKCSNCKQHGHNKTRCPKPSSSIG